MKAKVTHGIWTCLAALALPLVMACSRQGEALPEAGNDIYAVFTLDLGASGHEKMRAIPTDVIYDTGSGLENAIGLDNNDFRCYLFGTDNSLVSALDVVGISKLKEKRYSIRLHLRNTEEVKSALTKGCRFVLLANWGTYPQANPGMTIEELCTTPSAVFDFSQDKARLSEGNLIPMYGVKEFDSGVQDFKDGKAVSDIGTLHLLRAYAKIDVSVRFQDFMDETEVTSVSLTHSSGKGYKAPANVTKEADYMTGPWKTDYTLVNIPSDAADIEGLQLTKDEQTGHYVAYVPEYRNVDASNPSQLKIRFTIGDIGNNGQEAEGYVDFRHSDSPPEGVEAGQAFDIARNNWYKFNVVAKGKDIVWTVDVIPFTAVDLNPKMGLEREESTGYIIGKDSQDRDCWYDATEYPNDPKKRTPYYFGPKDNEGKFVTINDTSYLLVYTDFERTAAGLNHIFEKDAVNGTLTKHLLAPEGRTGYEKKNGFVDGKSEEWYQTKTKMRVWLDEGGDPDGDSDAQGVYGALKEIGLELRCCRILYEWDRLEWNKARWDGDASYRPKYWFDVLGKRYPWSEGDTDEKRKTRLGDWVKYLE